MATSIGIDRVGFVPSRILNVTWTVPLIGRMCISTTHSPYSYSLCDWLHLPTQYLTHALSFALSPLWTCGLDGPAVSPNCAPLPCMKSRDVSRNHVWCRDDTYFSANMILFDPCEVCAYRGQTVYCTTELCLSVDKLKKKNKQQGRQRQGRDGVSVQMSISM